MSAKTRKEEGSAEEAENSKKDAVASREPKESRSKQLARDSDDDAQTEQPQAGQLQERPQPRLRDYFRFRPLPWWLCFFLFTYLLTKLMMYVNSPCSVLGTRSPVTQKNLERAYRSLTKLRHPDLLRKQLGRVPTASELRRREIMFNQATAAKDELTRAISARGGPVWCYQLDLELEFFIALGKVGAMLAGLGIGDYITFFMEIFWNIVTFHSGIINTVLSLLWMGFLFKALRQFFMYLWRMGIIRGTIAFITTAIYGPVPTVLFFFGLPCMRFYAFVMSLFKREAIQDGSDGGAAVAQAAGVVAGGDAPAAPAAKEGTTPMPAAAARREDVPRNLRQRKKKETDEEREKRTKETLVGNPEANSRISWVPGSFEDGLLKCIRWSHREPVKGRQVAAEAVQFDVLLILTKPIIPLFMLISLGQVWSGLMTSLIIGHALRKWVPKMSHEAHHLLCVFFGAVHTLLGVSANQVEDFASREGQTLLHLRWMWSFKDVMAVMHMALLGATVTNIAGLGNEPSYASSFAAGIALRIFLAQDSVRALPPMQLASSFLEVRLRDLGVVLDQAEEAVTVAFEDAGGGPIRMLLGDGPQSRCVSVILKGWLILLPSLAVMQWLQRTVLAQRALGKKFKLMRLAQRMVLTVVGIIQCGVFAFMELNAFHGALVNFWVVMLFGCVVESLLSTYDVRGPVRQMVFLLLFILA